MVIMRFHPIVSIIFGVIVSFVLYLIAISVFGVIGWICAFQAIQGASWFGTFLLIISYALGGFIATYFAKKRKIQYALYEGILLLIIFSILTVPNSSLDVTKLLVLFSYGGILLILLAVTGGMFGQIINEQFNGFSPILAVIAGSIIGYSCLVLLTLFTGYAPDSFSLGAINIAVGVISFVIGGFLSAFLAKEKKIQIGIYTGLTILAIILIIDLIQMLTNHWPVYFHVIGFLGYAISAVIGSYMAIIVAKHLNKNIPKN
jgi:hypothetical protein